MTIHLGYVQAHWELTFNCKVLGSVSVLPGNVSSTEDSLDYNYQESLVKFGILDLSITLVTVGGGQMRTI